ncbi:hypothetical protein K3495_g14384 [Podosphaera aphanis]|nr:hypothetical protein K3495_g14384 [Podosphaera aphanis]
MDMLNPEKHLLVALQEPSVNKSNLDTYCPKGYWLCMEPKLETKVAFLVSKIIGENGWTFKWISNLVAEISVKLESTTIRVVNVYSPVTSGPELVGWKEIVEAIRDDGTRCLLLGDFNCHHPFWGGIAAPRDTRAQKLLNFTNAEGLHLATATGIPTFQRRGAGGRLQETIIDLTFASEDLINRIESCLTRKDWSIRQDHIPIEIRLGLEFQAENAPKRYAFHKADLGKMRIHLRECGWQRAEESLAALQYSIAEALRQHCPRARPSPYA